MNHELRRIYHYGDTGGNDAYTAKCECFWESGYEGTADEARKAHSKHQRKKSKTSEHPKSFACNPDEAAGLKEAGNA